MAPQEAGAGTRPRRDLAPIQRLFGSRSLTDWCPGHQRGPEISRGGFLPNGPPIKPPNSKIRRGTFLHQLRPGSRLCCTIGVGP